MSSQQQNASDILWLYYDALELWLQTSTKQKQSDAAAAAVRCTALVHIVLRLQENITLNTNQNTKCFKNIHTSARLLPRSSLNIMFTSGFTKKKTSCLKAESAVCPASERRHAPHLADDVGYPLGQSRAGLFYLETPGQQVVEGAVAHGHHGAGQADDIIGHAEVWSRQVDQQRLRVDAHEVAGLLFTRKTGERCTSSQTCFSTGAETAHKWVATTDSFLRKELTSCWRVDVPGCYLYPWRQCLVRASWLPRT